MRQDGHRQGAVQTSQSRAQKQETWNTATTGQLALQAHPAARRGDPIGIARRPTPSDHTAELLDYASAGQFVLTRALMRVRTAAWCCAAGMNPKATPRPRHTVGSALARPSRGAQSLYKVDAER